MPSLCTCLLIVSETGATFSEVPMMTTRSTLFLSSSSERSNTSSSFSPKNVMSGCTQTRSPDQRILPDTLRMAQHSGGPALAFIMPGGYGGGSGESDASLSQPSLRFLPLRRAFVGGAGCGTAQTLQSGTRWDMMSSAISAPGTRTLQWTQDAVAKEPWHCTTRCTPARVSSVSMFCV